MSELPEHPGEEPLEAAPPMPEEDAESARQASRSRLDRSLASGVVWTSAVKWSSQILTWASTLIVARLLTPADYGLVGMASLYLGLVTVLSEAGIGSAIVIQHELTEHQTAQLNTVSVLAGAAGFLLTVLLAKPIGAFFNAERLPTVLLFMALSYLVTGVRVVPEAVLRKQLRFKAMAFLEASNMIAAAIATVVLASMGVGYWALVFGPLFGVLVWTVGTLWYNPRAYAFPRMASIREPLTLSRHLLTSRAAWYAYGNADFLIAGKFLGQAALGSYTIGWSLSTIPITKISALVGRVAPPVFAAAQTDKAEMRRYLKIITEGLAFITFPASIGLALVAGEFVPFALGDQWTNAIWPLRILAAYATFRSVTPLLQHALTTVGGSRYAMHYSVLAAVVLPVGFYAGSHWGITGIAATWMLVHPVAVTIPLARKIFSFIDMRASEYLGALWPALNSSLIMSVVVLGSRALLLPHLHMGLLLAVEVLVGALTYVGSVYLFHRDRLSHIRRVIKLIRGQK